ncbi:hypothetical protein AMTRI_Chr06g196780 [Amborella trichopoda]
MCAYFINFLILGLILLFLRPCFMNFLNLGLILLFLKGKDREKLETILMKIRPTDPPPLLQRISSVLLLVDVPLLDSSLPVSSPDPHFLYLDSRPLLRLLGSCHPLSLLLLQFLDSWPPLAPSVPLSINSWPDHALSAPMFHEFLDSWPDLAQLQRISSVLLLVDLPLRDAPGLCHCPEPHLHTRQNSRKRHHQIL